MIIIMAKNTKPPTDPPMIAGIDLTTVSFLIVTVTFMRERREVKDIPMRHSSPSI